VRVVLELQPSRGTHDVHHDEPRAA
jgi:hypothetical protein